MYPPQTKPLFYSAAFFNWGAVLILALLAHPLGLQPPQDSLFGQITLAAIFIFGCGYWMVGQSPKANRGIAALGAFAKLAMVAVVFGHWLAGSATTQMAALVSGDIVYAVLFIWFLRRTPV
ncbi:hypothetical protein ACIPRI_03665 [Variovorax sp. LARHSF232]